MWLSPVSELKLFPKPYQVDPVAAQESCPHPWPAGTPASRMMGLKVYAMHNLHQNFWVVY